jgi:hypothetical protein
LAAFALLSFGAAYGSQPQKAWTDTIAVIKEAKNVVLTRQGDKASLQIKGSGSNDNYYYSYSIAPAGDSISGSRPTVDVPFSEEKKQGTTTLRFVKNVFAGANMPVGPGNDFTTGWEIAVSEFVGVGVKPWKSGPTFSCGVGFGYSTLSVSGNKYLKSVGNDLTIAEGEVAGGSSRLDLYSVTFPLLLTQKISKDWAFNFGAILYLNVKGNVTNKYYTSESSDNRTKHSFTTDVRFFTPEVFATIGWADYMGVYVKYSPMDELLHFDGQRVSRISLGVNLNF